MGMAASQFNFLALTARKSDIGFELQRLSNNKEALTRDMQNVTREYRNALGMKTLKWSGNSGVTYSDLSYSTLMKPGNTSSNSPYLITSSSGRIVIDEGYKQYAEMIADNGGKYDGQTRYKILSGLTGISEDTLDKYDKTKKDAEAKYTLAENARDARDAVAHKDMTQDMLMSKILTQAEIGYGKTTKIDDTNITPISQAIQKALIGKGYFTSDVEKEIKNICDSSEQMYKSRTDKDEETYKDYNVGEFVKGVFEHIKTVASGVASDTIRLMVDVNDGNRGTQSDYDAADTAYKEALSAYQSAVSANGEVLTGPEKKQIEYYDRLFQAIADMGWEEDESIANSDYLNQMLQNNSYYITTMTENKSFDENAEIDDRNYKFFYDTEFAENDPNIFKVNDANAQEEALVKYEYEKSLINEKESRIDTRMKNLETEQSAITKMLESIDRVKNDNIERTFGLWS